MPNTVSISVLLPAFNAERYVRQSVESVLAQTFEDFELLVINDRSTDGTAEILKSFQDPRLRVIDNPVNLGIVESLNRAFTEARGKYIARIDADDFCLPTRFAKQKAFLDQNPDVSLVATELFILDHGRVRINRRPGDPDPDVLRWMFHFRNPIGHPSMMFRADIVSALGCYLRKPFEFAEDFDFSHRILQIGKIVALPERLGIYRLHATNLTRTRRAEMVARVAAILAEAYARLFGHDAADDALLASEFIVSNVPATNVAKLEQIGDLLDRLVAAFIASRPLSERATARILESANAIWWTTVQMALRAGTVPPTTNGRVLEHWQHLQPPPFRTLAHPAARGAVKSVLPPELRAKLQRGGVRKPVDPPSGGVVLKGTRLESLPVLKDDPPTLYVVVDTEAEFDWSQPFARSLTSVKSISAQIKAQEIFDRFGIRPIYLVDYAVASQAEGHEPLRAILDRHGCAIGAHLHTWINPPFEEEPSAVNSFAGNLPPNLEERKLLALSLIINQNFGIRPLFFKAGRYGIGPETMAILHRLGYAVDFSIMPITDYASKGGVDFRDALPIPYRVAANSIVSLPMTRAHVGLLAGLMPRMQPDLRPGFAKLRVSGMMSRLGLANTVTLTPEGNSADEQRHLLRTLIDRGHRTFVMHYHSPSLAPGNTPYVRTQADLTTFLKKIETVCSYFCLDLGGMPGNPADLVPPSKRGLVWPAQDSVSEATAVGAR